MADVRLDRVSKAYDRHTVFSDLDLTAKDGECFTLLGPSGCGKTVIMRLIAGFEQPSAGKIFIGDNLVSSPETGLHLPPEARRIGVVFQDYAVWPHKTVFDNVIYPLSIQKVPKDQARRQTTVAIESVNLRGLEDRLPYQLSGGQQQRVALARALVSNPEIMLLDEPLCNLDANLREEMRFEIKELQKRTGVTILYVTHDQEIALALSDRIAIMDPRGKIRQVGTPLEIFESPADSYVYRFMGVSNFIPVRVENNRVFIDGSAQPLDCAPPDGMAVMDHFFVACRPTEIELTRNGAPIQGTVKRRNFLGAMIDYRIAIGDREVRVQQDTREAIAKDLILDEGERCGVVFLGLHWYEPDSPEEEAQCY
jgi:iron(III) transport system ATP-binding protein